MAAIGGALFGYDTGVISGALLYVSHDFQLDAVAEGVVTSVLLIGAAAGAVVGGRIADWLGRRPALIVAGVVFVFGTAGSAFAPDFGVLVASRLVLGIAVGVSSIIVPLYIAEMAPADVRGRLVSLNSLMIVAGQLAAYLVNAWLAQYAAWRWMLGLAAVPAIVLVIGMCFLPDTPTWYLSKGRDERALQILRRTYPEREAHREMKAVRAARQAQADENQGLRGLSQGWVRKALLLAIGIAILQQITGVNTVIYFAPTLLVQTGLSSSTAVISSIAIGAISVLATIAGLRLVDRIPRKKLLITGSLLGVGSLIALALVFPLSQYGTGFSFLTLGMMVLFLAFQQAAVATTTWLIISELVPSAIRGIGMGIAGLFLWLTNFGVSLLFLPVVAVIGGGMTFAVFAVIGVLGVLFVWRLVPETGGKTLPDIEQELRSTTETHGEK
jgi:MFS transporter, SP family, major inositol transporter